MRVYRIVDVVEFLFRNFAFLVEFIGELEFVGKVFGFFVIFDPLFL